MCFYWINNKRVMSFKAYGNYEYDYVIQTL